MVVGWNPAPNLSNSAAYNRRGLLRKGAKSSPQRLQSYQFRLLVGINRVQETGRQFDSYCGIEPASAEYQDLPNSLKMLNR